MALACLLGLAVAACGGKKTSASTDEDAAAGEPAEPSDERELRRNSNAVSPDSVKREVEQIQDRHERKVDESLDL